MASQSTFDFITKASGEHPQLFDEFHQLNSGKLVDVDIPLVTELRRLYPDLIVTTIPANNCNLLRFVAAGNATAELDTKNENLVRWRGYIPGVKRGQSGDLGDATFFAKYHYKWGKEDFILYTVNNGFTTIQYVLKEPGDGETTLSHSKTTDALISAIGDWLTADQDVVYVFDGGWKADKQLWNEVQKSSWDNVILDPDMKKELVDVSNKFFDSEDIYKQYGVPWKRGLIFYGPVGNGKTISIKALMHSLYSRKEPIPSLYVKSVYGTYQVRQIFEMARNMAPCMLVMEDMETIVYGGSRSYFFNEVDGLENNNGILMIGSTNYIERLDPGITKRPSRFDRKYLFPLPSTEERVQYCNFWRAKVLKLPKGKVDYPKKLVNLIAAITYGFSFAYLQEAFVATLLELARQAMIHESAILEYIDTDEIVYSASAGFHHIQIDSQKRVVNADEDDEDDDDDDDDDDLDKIAFWRVIREQVAILREDISRATRDGAALEEDAGLLSTPRKYWDSLFGTITGNLCKIMLWTSGSQVPTSDAKSMLEELHKNGSQGNAFPAYGPAKSSFKYDESNMWRSSVLPTMDPPTVQIGTVARDSALDIRSVIDGKKFFRARD